MVASSKAIAERFVPLPPMLRRGEARLWQFTRKDAAALVRVGIVPEDASTELLDGMIVHTDRAATGEDVLRVGIEHRITVERLSNLRAQLNTDARHVESQQPLACSDTNEPQPDFMVIRGRLEQYGEDGPTAADAYCVVEVADSSYERDSDVKLKGYARAGVQQYIIINLRNRTAEVYTQPNAAAETYTSPQIVTAEQSLSLRVGETEYFTVALAAVLP
jgi:hypothetical protein